MDGEVCGRDGEDDPVWKVRDERNGGLYGCAAELYERKEGLKGSESVHASELRRGS